MKRIIRIFFLIILVYCVFLFVESNFFIIKNIEVIGEYTLVKKDIVEKFENIKGTSLFYINTGRLQGFIEDDVRINSAKISRKFPDTLQIEIEERKPVAIVYYNGNYFYVDIELNIFALYKEIKDSQIPIINLPKEEEIEEFKNILRNIKDTKLYNNISEIYKKEKIYILTLLSGTEVYVDKEVSSKKYDLAYKIYVSESKDKNLEYMDLRFKDIVVK